MVDNKLPFNRALLWILVSTLLISGSAFMGWLYFQHVRERRFHDDQYRILAIIQDTPQADSLRTVYLAELLNLSLDQPINLYQFNTQEAVQTLLSQSLIKKAMIKKILPGTLYIYYQMRTPVAYVGDYSNTFIDKEGYLFPCHPFFTPKRLPTLYLGLEKGELQWGSCLKEVASLKIAFSLLQQFNQLNQEELKLKQLDVTQAQADSYGQRQIILMVESSHQNDTYSSSHSICLRLNSDHYIQDLVNFCTLQKAFLVNKEQNLTPQQEIIIDLRIPHLAFITSGR